MNRLKHEVISFIAELTALILLLSALGGAVILSAFVARGLAGVFQ